MASATDYQELRPVDRSLWKALAGESVQIPVVGSRAYYFPDGHAEQAFSTPDFSSFHNRRHFYLCEISSVQLLADVETDEVYARIGLVPLDFTCQPAVLLDSFAKAGEESGVASFPKVLTNSDANNGGGFSVPRFCADTLFPPLDYNAEPPVQMLSFRDVHGNEWVFRHIYRGTPRRHLLTTGWSRFVNNKRLVAEDCIVFVKNASDELFVGVRRGEKKPSAPAAYSWFGSKLGDGLGGEVTNGNGRVTAESVVDAVRLAEMNRPFEVLYYPRVSAEFVVRAEVVETAVRVHWASGVKIRMAVEAGEPPRTSWYEGTVSCANPQDISPWSFSPWRMLQVTWDEHELLREKSVSPWQVEVVPETPQIPSLTQPLKKHRLLESPELLTDREGNMLIPMSGFDSKVMGDVSPSPFTYNTFPAGMQGARQDPVCVSNGHYIEPSYHQHIFSGNLGENISSKSNQVSIDLNIWNSFLPESPSPPSQTSVLYRDKVSANTIYNPTAKAMPCSIMLFGKTIHVKQPVDFDATTHYNEAVVGVPSQKVITAVEACCL